MIQILFFLLLMVINNTPLGQFGPIKTVTNTLVRINNKYYNKKIK